MFESSVIRLQKLKLDLNTLQKTAAETQLRELDLNNRINQLFVDKSERDLEISRLNLELIETRRTCNTKLAKSALLTSLQAKREIVKELCELWKSRELAAELMYG